MTHAMKVVIIQRLLFFSSAISALILGKLPLYAFESPVYIGVDKRQLV